MRKRADLVEEITGMSIELQYKGDTNWIMKTNGLSYTINLAKPMVKGLPAKTALYHELSHALHKTFLGGVIQKLEKQAIEDSGNKMDALIDDDYKAGTKLSSDEYSEITDELTRSLKTMYIESFNIIEDQRIESLTSNIWLATSNMFKDARTKLGEQITTPKYNPNSQLLHERFFRHDLCPDKELAKALHMVEGGDEMLPWMVFKRHIYPKLQEEGDDILDKLVNKAREMNKNSPSHSHVEMSSALRNIARNEATLSSLTPVDKKGTKKSEVHMESIDEQLDTTSRGVMPEIRSLKHNRVTNDDIEEEILSQETIIDETESEEQPYKTEEEWESAVKKSKYNASQQVQEIKDSLTQSPVTARLPANCSLVKRVQTTPQIDEKVVKGLTKLLRVINENKRDVLNDTGDEVDIDGYINTKLSGHGDCFKETKASKGISLYISVDGSGSMDSGGGTNGTSMDNARTLMSSFFRVAQDFKEIEVRGDVWSSNYEGDVGITEINSLEDCKQLSTSTVQSDVYSSYYETPTHEAIKFASQRASKGFYDHKLLIIITDGYPQYTKKGYSIPAGTLTKMAQKNLKKALLLVPNIMCVSISGYSGADYYLKEIFTPKRVVSFKNMSQASEFIEKEFKRKLIEVLTR